LDGDEVLLTWTSGIASYLNIPEEEDYWSSEWDADSNSSTSDSGNELGSDPGTEHNVGDSISIKFPPLTSTSLARS
jgi:hypothetical protein